MPREATTELELCGKPRMALILASERKAAVAAKEGLRSVGRSERLDFLLFDLRG